MSPQKGNACDQCNNQRGQHTVDENHDLGLDGKLVLELIGQKVHYFALGADACQLRISDLVEHVGTDHADDEEGGHGGPDKPGGEDGEHQFGLLFQEQDGDESDDGGGDDGGPVRGQVQGEVVDLGKLFDGLNDLFHSFRAGIGGEVDDAVIGDGGGIWLEDKQSGDVVQLEELECLWDGLGGVLQIDLGKENGCVGMGGLAFWVVIKPRRHDGVVFGLQFETQRTADFGRCGGEESDYVRVFVRGRQDVFEA